MTRVEEIEARKAEILAAVDQEGADVSALETEVRGLNAELEAIKAEAEKRQAIRDAVSAGAGNVIKTFEMEERKMEKGILGVKVGMTEVFTRPLLSQTQSP